MFWILSQRKHVAWIINMQPSLLILIIYFMFINKTFLSNTFTRKTGNFNNICTYPSFLQIIYVIFWQVTCFSYLPKEDKLLQQEICTLSLPCSTFTADNNSLVLVVVQYSLICCISNSKYVWWIVWPNLTAIPALFLSKILSTNLLFRGYPIPWNSVAYTTNISALMIL